MESIVNGLIKLIDEKKGENLVVLDMEESTNFTRYIFVATINSLTHSKSLGKYIVDYFIENGLKNSLYTKKIDEANPWILIDCGSIVVHLFTKETREYYSLEKLYFKGKMIYP